MITALYITGCVLIYLLFGLLTLFLCIDLYYYVKYMLIRNKE